MDDVVTSSYSAHSLLAVLTKGRALSTYDVLCDITGQFRLCGSHSDVDVANVPKDIVIEMTHSQDGPLLHEQCDPLTPKSNCGALLVLLLCTRNTRQSKEIL